MKIVQFVKNLFNMMPRDKLQEDIRGLIKIEKEAVIPALEQGSSELGTKFTHPKLKALDETGRKNIGKGTKGSIIDIALAANKNAVDVLEFLYQLTETKFGDQIMRDGITYQKANLLRYLEVVHFITDYSLRFLRWAVVCETVANYPDAENPEQVFSPADLKWLELNLEPFFSAIKLCSIDLKTLEAGFDEIPEIVVTEDSDPVVTQTVGVAKLDPFNLQGFMPTKNPLYWLQMRWSVRNLDKYQARLEERQAIEMRLLDLRDRQKKNPNPKTAEQIEYHERRLAKLDAKIRDQEKDYA